MKFTLRLVSAIWLSVMLVIGAFAYLQIREERERLFGDLQRRAVLVTGALSEALEPAAKQSPAAVDRIVKKFGQTQKGIAVYDRFANLRSATPDVAPLLTPSLPEVTEAIARNVAAQATRVVGDRPRYIYATPLLSDDQPVGAVAVLLDASHLQQAEWDRWSYNALRFLVLALVISAIAALVVKISITRPMAEISQWTRALRSGRPVPPPRNVADANLFGPLALEVSRLARSMQRAQVAAEQEAALRLAGESVWTEERLKQYVHLQLNGRLLVVVSNREPVSHVWRGGQVQTQVPASGLVTAMDPMMRACGGVWVAHGSGDADRETADTRGRRRAGGRAPLHPAARLALEGRGSRATTPASPTRASGPCATSCTRGRSSARTTGRTTSEGEPEVRRHGAGPASRTPRRRVVLDPGLPLRGGSPALIKAERPDARVAIFWHIPWPNFEAFGICPWQREVLVGMLGADLIGFHTQVLTATTSSRRSTARSRRGIDWERFSVTRADYTTAVKPVPDQRRARIRGRSAARVARRAPCVASGSPPSSSAWGSSGSTTPRACRSV